MEELKPCPFCGGEAAQRDFTEPFVNGWVGCQKCHCFINWVKGGKPEAAAAWNRRAAPENKAIENCKTCRFYEKTVETYPCKCCGNAYTSKYAHKPE